MIQRIARLLDILTGKVLKTFQDLSDNDKISLATVRDKLLKFQNLMVEANRQHFIKGTTSADTSFKNYVS